MNIKQFVRNGLVIGGIASATSALAALAGGRHTAGKALPPLNAVSHIAWAGRRRGTRDVGRGAINTWMGGRSAHRCLRVLGEHNIRRAVCARRPARSRPYSGRCGKDSRDSLCHRLLRCLQAVPAWIRGVPESRFHVAVYASLAAGIALGAALTGLDHHQVKNGDERDKGGNAQ
jgi:hypothetical protein